MTKGEIAKTVFQLEELAFEALFRSGPWPADYAARKTLVTRIEIMGLLNPQPGAGDRITEFGRSCRLDLFLVFLGLFSLEDLPHVLLDHNLISDNAADEIWLNPCDHEAERVAKAAAMRAYRKVCSRRHLQ